VRIKLKLQTDAQHPIVGRLLDELSEHVRRSGSDLGVLFVQGGIEPDLRAESAAAFLRASPRNTWASPDCAR
jgi:hypothetical protein